MHLICRWQNSLKDSLRMQVTEVYSHKNGEAYIKHHHPQELNEICHAIEILDAEACLTKRSSEKTKPPLIFSPIEFNNRLKKHLCPLGWTTPAPESSKGFKEPRVSMGAREFREMDGIKNKVGLEIQFGKYAFMGYDIFSKMPIFHKEGLIDCGIEVVVTSPMIQNMSTGVSSFTQIRMDMEKRGEADIDIPTLVIGFECTDDEWSKVEEKRNRFMQDPEAMIASGEVSQGRKGAKPGPK